MAHQLQRQLPCKAHVLNPGAECAFAEGSIGALQGNVLPPCEQHVNDTVVSVG